MGVSILLDLDHLGKDLHRTYSLIEDLIVEPDIIISFLTNLYVWGYTIPRCGTGWSPREVIWLGGGPVATASKTSTNAPLPTLSTWGFANAAWGLVTRGVGVPITPDVGYRGFGDVMVNLTNGCDEDSLLSPG